MKKPVFIIIILLNLVIALSMIKAIAYNRLSTSGVFVGKVEGEINSLKTQNAILSEEFLAESSLTNISSKAAELGFVEDDSLMVLGSSRPLAVKQ